MQSQRAACLACEQIPVQCVFLPSNDSCEHCRANQLDCFSVGRKRRRTGTGSGSTPLGRTPSSTASNVPGKRVVNTEQARPRSAQSTSTVEALASTARPATGPASSGKGEGPSPNNETFIGRAHYLDHDTPFDETQGQDVAIPEKRQPSERETTVLRSFQAFELPPRAVRRSLLDSFLTYCQPWTPVLSRGELDGNNQQQPSLILCQSIFLAASRVSTAPSIHSFATPDQFYQRAKALFFMNHELDALAVIKATIMLQWYTPVGPEQVSYDAGEFWLRVGIGIAFQIGLHREPPPGPTAAARGRIWWTLMIRDALMTVAHGRPRAINKDDISVKPVRPEDLADAAGRGDGALFTAYTNICCILGDISETCSRNSMTVAKHQNFEKLLHTWPTLVPEHLRFPNFGMSTDTYMSLQSHLNLRQLHLPYLLSLAIIGRSLKNEVISAQSVIAASFIAGIYRDFLARDEIKHLAPIFSRYCIASGFFLALLQPLTEVWAVCQADVDIFRNSLQELGQRWKSAKAGLKALDHFINLRENSPGRSQRKVLWLTDDQRSFFDCFPRDYCLIWDSLHQYCTQNPAVATPLDTLRSPNLPMENNYVHKLPIVSNEDPAIGEELWNFTNADFEQFMWTSTEDWFAST